MYSNMSSILTTAENDLANEVRAKYSEQIQKLKSDIWITLESKIKYHSTINTLLNNKYGQKIIRIIVLKILTDEVYKEHG